MAIKVMDVAEFLAFLSGDAAKRSEHRKWYDETSAKVTEYARLVHRDGPEKSMEETSDAWKAYEAVLEKLFSNPARPDDAEKISDLERQINTLCKAVIFFMKKEKSVDYTITHEDLAKIRDDKLSLGVSDCRAHGIHLDIVDANHDLH